MKSKNQLFAVLLFLTSSLAFGYGGHVGGGNSFGTYEVMTKDTASIECSGYQPIFFDALSGTMPVPFMTNIEVVKDLKGSEAVALERVSAVCQYAIGSNLIQ